MLFLHILQKNNFNDLKKELIPPTKNYLLLTRVIFAERKKEKHANAQFQPPVAFVISIQILHGVSSSSPAMHVPRGDEKTKGGRKEGTVVGRCKRTVRSVFGGD